MISHSLGRGAFSVQWSFQTHEHLVNEVCQNDVEISIVKIRTGNVPEQESCPGGDSGCRSDRAESQYSWSFCGLYPAMPRTWKGYSGIEAV